MTKPEINEMRVSGGVGDLKGITRDRPLSPREQPQRRPRSRPRLLALAIAIAVSALLTWVCLDDILIYKKPVAVAR